MSRKIRRTKRMSVSARKELDAALDQAEGLLERNRPEDAVELLESMTERFGSSSDLMLLLGLAYMQTGDNFDAVDALERSNRSGYDPEKKVPLVVAYVNAHMVACAVATMTELQRDNVRLPHEMFEMFKEMRNALRDQAKELGLTTKRASEGFQAIEHCQCYLALERPSSAVKAGRTAVSILPSSVANARNLLAAAYFENGNLKQALQTIETSLEKGSDDPLTLTSAVQFRVWSGHRSEAETIWQQLCAVAKHEDQIIFHKMRATAIMEDDAAMLDLLQPVVERENLDEEMLDIFQYRLAVAEVNLGQREQGLERLQNITYDDNRIQEIQIALAMGRSGLGYGLRFAFTEVEELMPDSIIDEIDRLMELSVEESQSRRERTQLDRLIDRCPQLLLVGEKLIWDENDAESGITLLARMATPESFAALRRFGLGQTGPPEVRMNALLALETFGGTGEGEHFRFWYDDEWVNVDLQTQRIVTPEPEPHSDEVIELANSALAAQGDGDLDQAIAYWEQAVKLAPHASDIRYNLANMYANVRRFDESIELLNRVFEDDPNYSPAYLLRAIIYVDTGDLEASKEILAQFADPTQLEREHFPTYQCLLAQIAIDEGRIDDARRHVDIAAQVDPKSEAVFNIRIELVKQTRLGKTISAVGRLFNRRAR